MLCEGDYLHRGVRNRKLWNVPSLATLTRPHWKAYDTEKQK